MSGTKTKVLVAMSGGVDSSVAAALLLEQGYDVVGVFMRLGSPGETLDELQTYEAASDERSEAASDEQSEEDAGTPDPEDAGTAACNPKTIRIGKQGCCSINDAADARHVAAKLGIPFYVCNFKKDFGRIIDYFVDEYNQGRTPNPCVRCNDWLKFGKLHQYAKQIGAKYVASGHYARLETADDDTWQLRRGVDHDKDQSYVLFGAPRERLGEMLLPIGGYKKIEVRELARKFDLPVFNKPDSQEICFVPDQDYAGLVKRRSPDSVKPGRIIDTEGNDLGEHPGQQHFTIGQRRGIGVALGYPIYVVNKGADTNTITVGEKDHLQATGCRAREANWLVDLGITAEAGVDERSEETPGIPVGCNSTPWHTCTAKIRYNAEPVSAQVRQVDDDEIEVIFDEPQFAVAPGQAVVCYDGDRVICGGWITEAISEATNESSVEQVTLASPT